MIIDCNPGAMRSALIMVGKSDSYGPLCPPVGDLAQFRWGMLKLARRPEGRPCPATMPCPATIEIHRETTRPQRIDVDVEGMELGQAVYASDLKLPTGVSLQVEPDTLVLHVIARQTAEEAGGETAEAASEVPEALSEPAPAAIRE